MPGAKRPPSVDTLKRDPVISAFSDAVRTRASRQVAAALRAGDLSHEHASVSRALLLAAVSAEMPSLKPAINGTGVILHTGLGRAVLGLTARKHLEQVATGYCSLEIDLKTGERGDRQEHCRELLTDLTGAENALVVNNAAAGLYLALASLCRGGEVILSRGQMIEIGGAFRMPEIIRDSGCELIEVGCTNRTRLSDYSDAITERTSAVLRCHPSNFKQIGFVEQPILEDLADLAHRRDTILIDDIGHGCLVDLQPFGLSGPTTVSQSISGGSDVVIFSADKLLGGPQAGVIVGRQALIDRLRRHPLARAMRIDKLSLAALEGTLQSYLDGSWKQLPLYACLGRPLELVRRDAKRIAAAWPGAVIEESVCEVGGGALPGEGVSSYRVGLPGSDAADLATRLRHSHPPIVGRIERDVVWLDARTIAPSERNLVIGILKGLR